MTPSALDHVEEIAGRSDRLAVFLDFDGTLTAIVNDPKEALLSDSMRQTLQALAGRVSLAVLSGRDLDDIRKCVAIDAIIYAGSHGFDIAGPRGLRRQEATNFLPTLDAAEKELRKKLARIPGALIERKRFSIAAHYRKVNQNDVPKLKDAVSEVVARHRELRRMDGKKVYELLPSIDWDKGKAALWLLENLGLKHERVRPIYIGDDRTDEDAFRALDQGGVGILVSEEPKATAASYLLRNPSEVERFLRNLIAITA